MKKLIAIGSIGLLASCGYMARQVVAPNTCKKCEITNASGAVVWAKDECGGGVHNMELRAKAEAYDLGCGHKVSCTSYEKEETP